MVIELHEPWSAPIVCLEDIPDGYRVQTAFRTVSREAITTFAQEYDPQPMHIDPIAAREGAFGDLIGSGWQTLAITMRLLVDAGLLAPTPIVGAEFGRMRFHRPLRPGDSIQASATVTATRHSTSRPERGFVDMDVKTTDQSGNCLVEQEWTLMVPTRLATAR